MPEKTETPIMSFVGLLSEIRRGSLRIPDFQRDYIWSQDQVKELLDSVWNGYPIGSILLWKTTNKMKERDPLKLNLPDLRDGIERSYLLDGQQRLITLYAVFHDILELGKKRKIAYKVFFDLKNKKFEIYKKKDLEKDKTEPKVEGWYLPLNEIINIDYTTKSSSPNSYVIKKFSQKAEMLETYINLYTRFSSLEFPAITNNQDLSVACKIFERLNNTGTPLTIVDLMVATTYTTNFNLREKLKELILELDSQDFAISEITILQCISACLQKSTTKDNIIKCSKEIEAKWKKTIGSLKLSIDFIKKNCSVPVSAFIPNEILLAPLTYFFYKNGNKQLNTIQIKILKKYFWLGILSERYIQSQDTRIEEDIKNMEDVLSDSDKNVFDYSLKIDWEKIKNEEMSFSSSFAKAVLCFLAYKKPLEFINNTSVDLERTFGDANLKQLHHLFPQNFVKATSNEKERQYVNSIANISLISKTTNREIWDKKPSLYFKEFEEKNKELKKALESHLLGDLDKFGIKKDEFIRFIDERAKRIAEEINKFIEDLKSTSS